MKYIYFVSYRLLGEHKGLPLEGFGSAEIKLSTEITHINKLRDIEDRICKERDYQGCSILNYQLLRTE